VRSTPEAFFQAQILAKFPVNETNQLLRHYPADSSTNRRYLTLSDEKTAQKLIKKFLDYKCDTAVQNLYTHGVCKPFLIVQSKNSQLFNDAQVTAQLDQRHVFQKLALNRYTFLLELKVVKVFLEYDIAIYRTINVPPAVVRLLPSISLDYSSYDDDCTGLHCLQNSPSGTNLGRLLNRAQIEGILDQHSIQGDPVSGNYIFEGLRYLIRGYFRFGSSGAAGAALFYESLSISIYAGLFFLITHLFVVFYEEPTLRRTFGDEYEAYFRRVRRWMPALRKAYRNAE
jgi:hypothetical protein